MQSFTPVSGKDVAVRLGVSQRHYVSDTGASDCVERERKKNMGRFLKNNVVNLTVEVEDSAVIAAVDAANESILACNDAADYAMDAEESSSNAKEFTEFAKQFSDIGRKHSENSLKGAELAGEVYGKVSKLFWMIVILTAMNLVVLYGMILEVFFR